MCSVDCAVFLLAKFEFSRFKLDGVRFSVLVSRFKLDGCRLSVDGSRLIAAAGGFFTLDRSRVMAGSLRALEASFVAMLPAPLLLPSVLSSPVAFFALVVRSVLDGEDLAFDFCGIFVGDDLLTHLGGLGSREPARELLCELIRLFTLTLLLRRTGIFVGDD